MLIVGWFVGLLLTFPTLIAILSEILNIDYDKCLISFGSNESNTRILACLTAFSCFFRTHFRPHHNLRANLLQNWRLRNRQNQIRPHAPYKETEETFASSLCSHFRFHSLLESVLVGLFGFGDVRRRK